MKFPFIDKSFDLYKAIEDLGLSISEKDDGYCVAFGYIQDKKVIIEFYNSFLTGVQSDMLIQIDNGIDKERDQVYFGVAPQNKNDFDSLIQYLFPSDDFIEEIRCHYLLSGVDISND